MIKNFYIFRHGQCPLNISGHIQGQKFNGNLTAEGWRQAAHTGELLKNRNISLIITSPMKRAMQTASVVAKAINAPVWLDRRFIEVNMGIVEGMHISTVEKYFAELYDHWKNDLEGTVRFTNGESKSEVRQRILQGLNFYATETKHENIAVSSHGIAISQMMLYLGHRCTNIPNGSILHISCENKNWSYHELLQ